MRAVITLVCLSILSTSVAANGKAPYDLSNLSFDEYLKEFKLQYDAKEITLRQKLFDQEKIRIKEHNARNLSWKESLNKFSVMTPQEKKVLYGRNKAAAAHHGHRLKSEHGLPANFVMKPLKDLPTSVDWREKGVVSAVKDQGSCGSCWAFGSTATIESHVALATGYLFDLSVQQMAMCAPNPNACGGTGGCGGSTAELAFEYVTTAKLGGLYQEYQYGYASYYGQNFACQVPGVSSPVAAIDGYVQLPGNNYTTLMNAVATVGPVAINVDASTWGAYSSGVFSGCNPLTSDINHVVVLVGYGVDAATGLKYWLVRNSWSPTYGEAGYIRVLRTDNDDTVCQIDKTPQDGVACQGQDEAVTTCGTCGIIYDASYPLNARLA